MGKKTTIVSMILVIPGIVGAGCSNQPSKPSTAGTGGSPSGTGGATATGGVSAAAGGMGGASTGAGGTAGMKNGVFWNDTKGKRIEAHGGGFFKEGDTWYWIGEDKSATPANPKAWVNLYASKALVTWEFRNSIVTRNTSTELAAADRVIERPKLTYNDSTKQYVLWLHYENSDYSTAVKTGTFASDATEKVVSFTSTAARYIRFRALSEIAGKAYAAVAELNVVGTAQ